MFIASIIGIGFCLGVIFCLFFKDMQLFRRITFYKRLGATEEIDLESLANATYLLEKRKNDEIDSKLSEAVSKARQEAERERLELEKEFQAKLALLVQQNTKLVELKESLESQLSQVVVFQGIDIDELLKQVMAVLNKYKQVSLDKVFSYGDSIYVIKDYFIELVRRQIVSYEHIDKLINSLKATFIDLNLIEDRLFSKYRVKANNKEACKRYSLLQLNGKYFKDNFGLELSDKANNIKEIEMIVKSDSDNMEQTNKEFVEQELESKLDDKQ